MSSVLTPEIVTALPHHLSAGKSPILNGLSLKQSAFLDKYLETQNATQSVKYAYNITDDNVAAVRGHQLLRLDKIKQELKRRLGIHIADSSEVLERLTQHARGDLTDCLQPDGSFNLRKARKSGASKLLKKLKIKRRYEKDSQGNTQPVDEYEYEIHDPQAALTTLGRWMGLDKSQEQANESGELTLILRELLERAKAAQAQLSAADVNPTNSTP